MNRPTLVGTLGNRPGSDPADRVFAVREHHSVVSESGVHDDGSWSLDVAEPVDWVVGQLRGSRLAAVASEPSDALHLELPSLSRLVLRPEGPVHGASVWLDPVEIDGYPRELSWALRSHPGSVIDLHIGAYVAEVDSIILYVQRGTYRISGGRLSLHPGSSPGTEVAHVVDESSGSTHVAGDGSVDIAVDGDALYRVTFAEVAPPEAT